MIPSSEMRSAQFASQVPVALLSEPNVSCPVPGLSATSSAENASNYSSVRNYVQVPVQKVLLNSVPARPLSLQPPLVDAVCGPPHHTRARIPLVCRMQTRLTRSGCVWLAAWHLIFQNHRPNQPTSRRCSCSPSSSPLDSLPYEYVHDAAEEHLQL